MPSFETSGTRVQPHLIAGDFPLVTEEVTVASGEDLTAGAVIGKVTADGKVKLSDEAASDGSEELYAVLAEDCDATDGDKVAVAYLTGQFNEESLSFGGTRTAADTKAGLRALSIFIKSSVTV